MKDEERQKYCSAYLGIDREILDYLPSNRWTLLGRILLQINEQFLKETIVDVDTGEIHNKSDVFKTEIKKIRDELLFSVCDDRGNKIMTELIEILQTESANQLNRPKSEFCVDLNLYDPWNFYKTLQLIVKEFDTNLEFQASNLGMGVQASISIAILTAYSKIKLKNSTPIFIDEPELFLHPQAQRNFYNILKQLAKNETQIFYTTHSPNFISAGAFDEVYVMRKQNGEGTKIFFADTQKFIKDIKIRYNIDTDIDTLKSHYKNAYENTGDTQKANEGFFAKRIILVEGQSESLILPYLFEISQFDYIKEGISIVTCGSKIEIDRFLRLYSEFKIPCFVIFDGDKHLETTKEKSKNIEKNKNLLNYLNEPIITDYPDNIVKNNYLGFEYTLEKNLGFQPSANKKGLDLFFEVKDNIKTIDKIPKWINEIWNKMVLIQNIDVKSILKE